MEDETQPASVEDGAPGATDDAASDIGAPATSPPEGFIEQDRYENLRKEFNQRNSLIDRAKSGDNDALRELIGAEFAQDEEVPDLEDEEQDPYSTLEQRVAAQEERAQQREQQEGVERFNADLDKLAAKQEVTLTDRERTAIYIETLQGGGDPDALQKVFNGLMEERTAQRKAWEAEYFRSKKNAPHVSPGGTGATDEVLPLDATHDQRVEYMAQRMGLANES